MVILLLFCKTILQDLTYKNVPPSHISFFCPLLPTVRFYLCIFHWFLEVNKFAGEKMCFMKCFRNSVPYFSWKFLNIPLQSIWKECLCSVGNLHFFMNKNDRPGIYHYYTVILILNTWDYRFFINQILVNMIIIRQQRNIIYRKSS